MHDIGGLSAKEARFLANLASRDMQLFTTSDAQTYWGERQATDQALYRLERRGWLYRLEGGVYMIVPLEAGPERRWSTSALAVAPYLIEPSAIAYWTALHYWHLTEQIPRTTFVQSTARKRPNEKEILGMRFRFVQIAPVKFFGIVRRSVGGQAFTITDAEKTLVDAADRPELSGGIAQLAQSLRLTGEINWEQLTDYLLSWPLTSPIKRIGYLVDTLGIGIPNRQRILQTWGNAIAKGVVLLAPGHRQDGGSIVSRWQVRINVAGPWTS